MSEDIRLKVELQASGARLKDASSLAARIGGAGPTDGVTLFLDDIAATVPTQAPFVAESPYELVEGDSPGRGALLRDGQQCRQIEFALPPSFSSRQTDEGVPFDRIMLRHGRDAIGSTVAQTCARVADACKFCGITVSRDAGSTARLKQPDQIAQVAAAAVGEGYSHAVLTTGTTSFVDCGIAHLEKCALAIRESTDGAIKVHVQFEPPADEEWIGRIAAAADSVAINMECFDEQTLSRVAPGKAATGLACYERAWKKAVAAFGQDQVSCFILAGLGEDPCSITRGCELLTSLGVYPFVLPFRPIRGTPLESHPTIQAEPMLRLYEQAAEIIATSGLSARNCAAGCVKCGACSAITDW